MDNKGFLSQAVLPSPPRMKNIPTFRSRMQTDYLTSKRAKFSRAAVMITPAAMLTTPATLTLTRKKSEICKYSLRLAYIYLM